MAKYLVTGGAGFIGSHLVDALIAHNHQVVVLDNLSNGSLKNIPSKAKLVKGDVLDAKLLAKLMQDIDVCFHLAAIPSITECTKNWVKTHEINATGTVNVLNAARPDKLGRQVPVIFASSCAVYGVSSKARFSENDKTVPISPYGADKLASELHAYVAFHQFNIPTVCVRIFNAYGPRQKPDSPYSGVISIFIDRLKNQQPVTIFGNGNQARDFIYVKDIATFFIKASQLKNQSNLIVNACTGRTITINNLFKVISKVMQRETAVDYEEPRPGDVYHACGNPRLARKMLAFQPEYSLEAGLMDFLSN